MEVGTKVKAVDYKYVGEKGVIVYRTAETFKVKFECGKTWWYLKEYLVPVKRRWR